MMMGALTKLCYRCNSALPLKEFGRDRQKRDGLSSYCKACKADMNAEWFASHQQQRNEQGKQFYRNNTERILSRRRELYRVKRGSS